MPTFYEDVIKNDARFNSVNRVADPGLVEPVTRAAIASILNDARALGIELMIFETYRSQARQQELFNQGASKLRVVGVHHYGLACDLVKVAAGEPSWKGNFSFLGRLAHDHRRIWGGDWVPHPFIDAVHVQRCAVSLQPALFQGTFYPDGQYDPYAAAARATIAV